MSKPPWRRPRFIFVAVVAVVAVVLVGYPADGSDALMRIGIGVAAVAVVISLVAFVYVFLKGLGAFVRAPGDFLEANDRRSRSANGGSGPRLTARPLRDQNIETITQTRDTLVRAYHAGDGNSANKLFKLDAAQLGRDGWSPASQNWAVGNPGIGRLLAVGIYAFGARPKGTLTVIYGRTGPTKPATGPSPTLEIPEQIRRLGELRDSGLITSEEFDSKKSELLGRM